MKSVKYITVKKFEDKGGVLLFNTPLYRKSRKIIGRKQRHYFIGLYYCSNVLDSSTIFLSPFMIAPTKKYKLRTYVKIK